MLGNEANEKARIAALKSYNILDTLSEEEYDRITRLATQVCGTKISLISLIDEKRQWFKSKYGFDVSESPREFSFCAHAINTPNEPFIVENTATDNRFNTNPFVLGEPHVVFYAGFPLLDSNNKALGTLCVMDDKVRNLTEFQLDALKTLSKNVVALLELRKRNIHHNEEKKLMHETLELNNPFYFILNNDGIIEKFGNKIHKIYPEIKVGESFNNYYQFIMPFNFENWINNNEGKTQKLYFFEKLDKSQRFKFTIKKSEEHIIISSNPVINTKFSIKNYNLTLNDFVLHDYISEYLFLQQTTERSLKESRAITDKMVEKNKWLTLLENFINKVSDEILVFDDSGKLIFYSEASKFRLNNSKISIDEYDLTKLDAKFSNPEIFEEFLLVTKSSGVFHTEQKIIDPENDKVTHLDINIKYESVFDAGYFITICRDVTFLKESKEEELRQVLKVTQLQNDRLKNFAHIVSHNLRSHSANIRSLLNLFIEENPPLSEDEYMVMLKMASENLSETISHLAEIAALNVKENNQLEIINLSEIVDKAIMNVSALALKSAVTIKQYLPQIIQVKGIKAYLDSVILNFITNGIKYADPAKQSYLHLKYNEDEKFIYLSFEDNGLGIDLKRNADKLFGLYKTFHKNPEARGIGLFITKNQVEAMGGKINVESKLGEGSTFTVSFEKVI
jgi:signal transduction histidine kinase